MIDVVLCVIDCLFFWSYVGIVLHTVNVVPSNSSTMSTHMLSLYDFTTLPLCEFAYRLSLGPDPFGRRAIFD